MRVLSAVPGRPAVDQTIKRLMDVGDTANSSHLAEVNAERIGELPFIDVRQA